MPTHINEYGFEVDEHGDLVRTPTGDYQRTPGAVATNAHTGTDSRGLTWLAQDPVKGGRRQYVPDQAETIRQGQENDSGGLIHGRKSWNPDTGEYEQGLDWGKILSMVVAGTLTAGAASAMMGGGAAADAAISSTVATGQVPADIAGGAAAGTAGATGGAGGLTAGGVVKAGLSGYSTLKKLQGLTSGSSGPQDGSTVDQFGRVMGAAAKSEADSRRYDASLQGGMDANNNRAQVDAAKFNLGAPDTILNRLTRVATGLNAKDVGPTGDPRIDKFRTEGGLKPSLLQDPTTQQGFKEAQRQALLSLMNKDYKVNPTMSRLPEPGKMEKVGGAIATGTGLAQTGKGIYDAFGGTATKIPDWSGPIDQSGWEDWA